MILIPNNTPNEHRKWIERQGGSVIQHIQGQALGCSSPKALSCPSITCLGGKIGNGCACQEENHTRTDDLN